MVFRTTIGWKNAFIDREAFWRHRGGMLPHVRLTSGLHSDGFANCRPIMGHNSLAQHVACDLVDALIADGLDIGTVHVVAGPATGATKLAELMSGRIRYLTGKTCLFVSPTKHGDGDARIMTLTNDEERKVVGDNVLVCDDVATTAGSANLTADAIVRAGGIVLPYAGVIVNRSGLTQSGGRKIACLINEPMSMWLPDECPLCHAGSDAISSAKDNWARFNER